MSVAEPPPKAKPSSKSEWSAWAPRLWMGMRLGSWLRLFWINRFDVGWQYWHIALAITWWSSLNSLWTFFQKLTHGWRVSKVEITEPPIFIIGHWRSGTTLLHEMLVMDPRFGFPTTYECLAPNHFLRTEWIFGRILKLVLPHKRPMDNMPMGLHRPQEDEFALCGLGLPSPYRSIAFPNRPPLDQEYLTLRDVPPEARRRWQQGLMWFLRNVTFKQRKRLVLKSPPHTARIAVLLEMFPEARFVHIVRDPRVVFPSTVNLWKKLSLQHGLQQPNNEGLEERVLQTFLTMYEAFDADLPLVPKGHFAQVRYEELVSDPVAELQRIYEELGLGEFEQLRPRLEAFWAGQKDYQPNSFKLASVWREQVEQRWGAFMQRYGYAASED